MNRRILTVLFFLVLPVPSPAGSFQAMAQYSAGESGPLLKPEDLSFLKQMAADVVEASRVRPGDKVGDFGPNLTGATLIRPGGRKCYPAFWIRDYAMSLASGCISLPEQRKMLLLTARNQPDIEIRLASGSRVPPGSIPDHITFEGKPIYFPGTLEDYQGQGGKDWGEIPPLDDSFFFIDMAATYVETSGDFAILQEDVRGKRLLVRLEEAFAMPPSDPDTGLVIATNGQRGIAFGFTDTTLHTGRLLVPSLLKYRAARELSRLFLVSGDDRNAARYRELAATLKLHIGPTFQESSGLLRAATDTSAQPDVWGSALAVCIDALEPDRGMRVCGSLEKCLKQETIAWQGGIRHIPTDMDFNEKTSWEVSLVDKNTYQNGAYWGTATGWVCRAVARVNRSLAGKLAEAYIRELREGDYRRGDEFGSPWECIHPNGHRQNPVYMTSVTVPLGVFTQSE